jgi:hypothetical protein
VYIFNPSTGALLETLENPNSFGTVDNDKFGTVMSASTTHLLIGVPDEDAVSADNSGAAYIYKV